MNRDHQNPAPPDEPVDGSHATDNGGAGPDETLAIRTDDQPVAEDFTVAEASEAELARWETTAEAASQEAAEELDDDFAAPSGWRWRWELWRSQSLLNWRNWGERRLEGSAVLLALLLALGLTPQVFNFARRDQYVRQPVRGAWLWQPLEAQELRLYDARFSAREPIQPRSLNKIAIVAIDQSSITRFGDWPWPRQRHAALIRRLRAAGARVIAVDIDFSSYFQKPTMHNGETVLAPPDRALVDATRGGDVIYPVPLALDNRFSGDTVTETVTELTVPFDELDAETVDLSLAGVKTDFDGHVRNMALRGRFSDSDVASFAALAVGIFQMRLDETKKPAFYRALQSGSWPDIATGRRHRIPLTQAPIGDNAVWLTPLYFYGPPGTFPTYSYADVLNEYSPTLLRKYFGGRIVFVGATAQILKDLFAMPAFDTGGNSKRNVQADLPGVEMHATLAAQMLDGDYIRTASTQSTLAALFGMSMGLSAWILLLREPISHAARRAQLKWARRKKFFPQSSARIHSPVWFALYALAVILPLVGFWEFCVWVFIAHHFWLPAIYPLLAGALSGVSALLMLFVAEAGEHRKAMTHFGRTVSRDILEEMMATPEEDYRAPRRVEATVLFSDLEGFTTYSENREPEEVVAAINAYMDCMVPIVEAHGGSIDKFIGDAIMAFWNAPFPRYDHAAQALLCAVALQDECARFRERTGIPFSMRVGVHTGPVLYGDVGSSGRHNVTVIGDTVNIASRLESKNKEFGSRILCSQSTFEAAPGLVEAESAAAQIKGKSQTVEVFLVRGPRGAPDRELSWSPSPALEALDAGDGHKILTDSHSSASTSNHAFSQSDEDSEELRALGGALPQLTQGNQDSKP